MEKEEPLIDLNKISNNYSANNSIAKLFFCLKNYENNKICLGKDKIVYPAYGLLMIRLPMG